MILSALASLIAAGGTGTPSSGPGGSGPVFTTSRAAESVGAALQPQTEAFKPVAAFQTASLASRAHTVLFGAWIKPRGSETHQQAVARMESKIGRRFSVDHVYHGWDRPLIGPYERWSAARGHTLLINWKAVHETADGKSMGDGAGYVRWADIASGRYDAAIVARAREIKRFKKVVYLAFHHEPENDQDKPGWRKAGTPADYRSAWKHIRKVFRSQHVTNVRFVLILMGWTFRSGRAAQWFPGSGVIDVVGADAFNWFGTPHPGSGAWTTFRAAFQAAQRFAAAKGKPVWVTETGSQEDASNPGRKGGWYRSIAKAVKVWRNLGAVVFYMGGENGWFADSSQASLRGLSALARNSLFK